MADATRKIVAYIRVSTGKQEASGLGLEAQQASIAAYRQQTGSVVVAEYREIESGKVHDRPELAKAIAHAKRSDATLVIAKLDRLSRSVHFISGLMESGVHFISADSPNDEPMVIHMKAAFAEEERKRISRRTKDALAALKARGVKLGSARPGAVRLKGGSNPEASRLGGQATKASADAAYCEIGPIVIAFRAGGLSLQAIADRLNADGQATRRGRPWNKVQVARILERNEHTAGV